MITLGKRGDLVSRRSALAFLHNDTEVVNKVFDDLAKRYEKRDGGYTRILSHLTSWRWSINFNNRTS